MIRLVLATRGQVGIINAADWPKVRYNRWHAVKTPLGNFYLQRAKANGVPQTALRMHNIVATPSGDQVADHLNCDTTDNRRENLEAVPWGENGRRGNKPHGGPAPLAGLERDAYIAAKAIARLYAKTSRRGTTAPLSEWCLRAVEDLNRAMDAMDSAEETR